MAPLLASMLGKFANIALKSRIRDDDVIDQMNHWATVGLLTALAVGTGAKQYVGNPIHCWLPAEYKKKHYRKYSESFCWIHPMYSVPMDDPIPFQDQQEDRWENDLGYYRWVFIMFLIQAFLFKLPNIVWRDLKDYSGLNVSKIVGMAWETSMMTQDKRDKTMNHIAIFINRWLKTYSHHRYSAVTQFRDRFVSIVFCLGKRSGNYLSGLYMFTKLLYFINIIGQFFLVSKFLDLNFWNFGFEAMSVFFKKGMWQDHYNFPRIGYCDYKVRQLENRLPFTVQCVLSINMFLEKMYLILWFWMVMMLVFNTINLIHWLYLGMVPNTGKVFISKYLRLLHIDAKRNRKLFIHFVRNYLRTDGVFMLRIVANNTSEILTTDLMKQLWEQFKETNGHLTEDNDNYDSKDTDSNGRDDRRKNGKNKDDMTPPPTYDGLSKDNNNVYSTDPTAPQVMDNDDDLPPKS